MHWPLLLYRSLKPELLNESVLKCQMSTFNAAFCLAGFSTQRSNIKAAHGPGKLGIAETGGGVLIIDSEYAGFIAVEDHRFTVFSGGRSHQFVSARQYKDAGNEADEFSVRVVCGDPESRVYHETSDGFFPRTRP